MADMKRVNIRVTEDIHKYFMNRANNTGVSMSALMFLALEQYVQQQNMLPHIPNMMNELNKK